MQFVGAWDECSTGTKPNWVIKNLQLVFGKAAKASTFEAEATASRQGTTVPVTYQWQRNDGAGYTDIAGANTASLRLFPVTADFDASFRLVVTVPGKTVTSDPVKLVEGTVETPTITIAKSAAAITINYSGTLQSATAAAGPYTNVTGAQTPYTVPTTAAATFFRSVK